MVTVIIKKQVTLPDPVMLGRYEKSPDLGPKVLFFSGGTALRELSNKLIRYTYNSIHLVTPFDSGGSSAKLRQAFRMPAVGDIRNRLMALADQSIHGNPEIYDLFAHRLSMKKSKKALLLELEKMETGKHPLVAKIPDPLRKIVRQHFFVFRENMPADFDLRGASLGNLVLTAGYLNNRRHLDPVVYIFSKLVRVRGIVRPVTNKDLHLAAELEDGKTVLGQHLLTGKEVPPITSKVKRIFLSQDLSSAVETRTIIRNKTKDLIGQADLICYPMGSFYTSLLANVLPEGVGQAIKDNPCPKIYIPNTNKDPESLGLNVFEQVERLIMYLKKDDPERTATTDVLDFVLLDTKKGRYPGKIQKKKMLDLGIQIIDCPLISPKSKPYIDANYLVPVLLSLA
jgi:CofD-related protein of GAK system